MKLVRKHDPTLDWTIPVLTKIDRLEKRTEKRWVDKMLEGVDGQGGEAGAFYQNCWLTRQRNAEEMEEGIDFDEARARESAFFAEHPV